MPGRLVPAHPLIPIGGTPGGRSKQHAGNGTVLAIQNQVLHVFPYRAGVPQVMVTGQEKIVEGLNILVLVNSQYL